MRSTIKLLLTSLVLGAAAIGQAHSDDGYPKRPISLVVPFAAGGAVDIVGRLVADQLTKGLGQPVVVENVTGAGGTIGAGRVARAAPDGYTMLVGNLGTQVASIGAFKKLPYNPRTDFAPVMIVANAPEVLLVSNDVHSKSLKDFVELTQTKGPQVTIGHAGVGSISHLAYLLYTQVTKASSTVPVPYRGDIEADKDLLGGRISSAFNWTVLAAPYVNSGQLRALAVLAQRRSSVMPDVPTSAELGFPALAVNAWTALFFPRDTPPAIIERVNSVLRKSFEDEALVQKMKSLGLDAPTSDQQSTQALNELLHSEFEKWLPLMQSSGPENALK